MKKCAACGSWLSKDDVFCSNCGTKYEEPVKEEKKILTETDILSILDACYNKAIQGFGTVSPSIEDFSKEYLEKNPDGAEAAKAMIKNQIAKCATSGFLTGFGGLITLPVVLPANIGSVLYVQMRMIACTAYLAGYDLKSEQVRSLVYACMAGVSVNAVAKQAGVRIGMKITNAAIEKIPVMALVKVNKAVGFRLLTKFSERGVINLWRAVPGIAAVIGGGMDLVETKMIADRAYKMFFEGDLSAGDSAQESGSSDAEDVTAEGTVE